MPETAESSCPWIKPPTRVAKNAGQFFPMTAGSGGKNRAVRGRKQEDFFFRFTKKGHPLFPCCHRKKRAQLFCNAWVVLSHLYDENITRHRFYPTMTRKTQLVAGFIWGQLNLATLGAFFPMTTPLCQWGSPKKEVSRPAKKTHDAKSSFDKKKIRMRLVLDHMLSPMFFFQCTRRIFDHERGDQV